MSDTPRIVVTGASGRMGQMLIKAILDSDACTLSGVLDRKGSDVIGLDAGRLVGRDPIGIAVTDDALDVFATAHAVIDFTQPDATVEYAHFTAQARLVHVIGTTGFEEKHLVKLRASARHATLVRAGNMSLGVNLLTGLVEQAAKALGVAFDIEVVEAHHKHKVDAPSGTALMLGQAAAEGRGVNLDDVRASPRDGITGARTENEIGFSVIRGGDVVGEHEVMFLGEGERISLRHVATDRALFARGALRAALWGIGKPPGDYDMQDVLGLSAKVS